MAGLRLGGRNAKRPPLGFCAKVTLVMFLGLSSVVIWSIFSSPLSYRRTSFGDLSKSQPLPPSAAAMAGGKRYSPAAPPPPAAVTGTGNRSTIGSLQEAEGKSEGGEHDEQENGEAEKKGGGIGEEVGAKNATNELDGPSPENGGEENGEEERSEESEEGTDEDIEGGVDVNPEEDDDIATEAEEERYKKKKKKRKKMVGPVFDPTARYNWKLCGGRIGQNYMPCLDMEGLKSGRLQHHRHHERSCPRAPPMCLVPLPQGYRSPFPWPERESKIWYKNVAHPMLSALIKTRSWLNLTGEHLVFPRGESEVKGGAHHYLDSIEEMVPDIEWGKNIRVVLDIGCTDASFGATLLEKDVITLSLGLMYDQTDLAQLALERGFPALVGSLGTRRLPFPSSVFDAIHCGECQIQWHSSGGRLLLEMNRILRPGGYFIISSKIGDIDSEKGMSTLMASICWNILAHKTDEISEVGVKIYQRPASNDIYELRRRNEPPLCKEDENQDAAWYVPMKTCLHKVPAAIEQRGTDWPEEWPKRLETFPEWLGDLQGKLTADNEHWKSIISKSYLIGMGIDWSNIRNIMDMKAIYGGFAAALASQKVWVMNVVPVNAPNTLPIIYERGLLGIYHDWCEPFGTYPRSYDLLHADHLFSRLKNRCKQPISIVVEMDRILRPGGWAIIRDKLEILNPLETILKSLHWEIRMTYAKDKEGIICVQKTTWRPSAT